MLDEAISFAATAHAGQKRKYTGEPYIVHPIEVMQTLWDHGERNENVLTAAILHDVIEDTGANLITVERRFGPAVAVLVHELTEPELPGNRKTRKAAEVQRLAGVSVDAANVKLADLLSNSRSIVPNDPGFARVYIPEKEAILEVLQWSNVSLHHAVKTQLLSARSKLFS